jgi:hypothetical protein
VSKREPLDEQTLRDTRDELVKGLTDMARAAGGIPSARMAEDFVNPILNKVMVDHEAAMRGEPESPVVPDRQRERGEWAGSERKPEAVADEKVSFLERNVGEYQLLKGGGVRPIGDAPKTGEIREAVQARFKRLMIQALIQHKEWKQVFHNAMFICGKHLAPVRGCAECSKRERFYDELLANAVRLYGDPRKDKSKIISVGAAGGGTGGTEP